VNIALFKVAFVRPIAAQIMKPRLIGGPDMLRSYLALAASAVCLLAVAPSPGAPQERPELKPATPISEARLKQLENIKSHAIAERRRAMEEHKKALKDPDPAVRAEAARGLSELDHAASSECLSALIDALSDENPTVRYEVVMAIGQLRVHASGATAMLIKRLEDPDLQVRRQAVTTLGLIQPDLKLAVPALMKHLRDKDIAKNDNEVSISQRAAKALGNMGARARAALPVLIEIVKSPDHDIQRQLSAVAAIGRIGIADSGSVVPFLRDLVQNRGNQVVASAAAGALGEIGPDAKEAVPDVIAFLVTLDLSQFNSPSERLSRLPIKALGQIGEGSKEAAIALGEIARRTNAQRSSRQAALRALAELGKSGTPALPALLAILKEPADTFFWHQSTALIIELGGDPLPQLLLSLRAEEVGSRRYAVSVLAANERLVRRSIHELRQRLAVETDREVLGKLSRVLQGIESN
jgi:HEAT repeat protein